MIYINTKKLGITIINKKYIILNVYKCIGIKYTIKCHRCVQQIVHKNIQHQNGNTCIGIKKIYLEVPKKMKKG